MTTSSAGWGRWPVENPPRSVTVAASTWVESGMMATQSVLQGVDAEHFLDAQGVKYWAFR